jgi:hypothetical protein
LLSLAFLANFTETGKTVNGFSGLRCEGHFAFFPTLEACGLRPNFLLVGKEPVHMNCTFPFTVAIGA